MDATNTRRLLLGRLAALGLAASPAAASVGEETVTVRVADLERILNLLGTALEKHAQANLYLAALGDVMRGDLAAVVMR